MSDTKNKIRWTKAKQRGIKKNFTKHNYKIKKELYPIIHGGANYYNNTVSYEGITGEKEITLINYDNEKENMKITIKNTEFNLKNIIALAKAKIKEITRVTDDNLITLGISGIEGGLRGFYMLEGITTSSDRSNVYKVLKDNPIRYIIPPPKTGEEVKVVEGNITLSCRIILMGDIININIDSNKTISELKNKILEDAAITKKGITKINLMYDGITIKDDTAVIKNIIKTITEILIIPIIDHLDEIPDPPPAPPSAPPPAQLPAPPPAQLPAPSSAKPPGASNVGEVQGEGKTPSRSSTAEGKGQGRGTGGRQPVPPNQQPVPPLNQAPSKFCITEKDLPNLIKHFDEASTSLKNVSIFYSNLK
jgi:hypothetical protein